MQEQAINTFEEGLVMDLNPLTTPNNVLTNALNGTMITFNGNEFVLQNDMGNGRVETAYLPSGYVPVGIKEYGGIIYVASYNPITNKGQIGSFPSPERNISSDELSSKVVELTKNDFGFDEVNGVSKFVVTKELMKEGLLRPGDKFSIQIKPNDKDMSLPSFMLKLKELLTGSGLSEADETLVSNPLTIKVCIMSSDGNLVDITDKLKKINQPIESEEKIINYFLEVLSNSTGNSEFTKPSDDYLNVFNNKIAGRLYIVAELPSIFSSSLGSSGKKSDKEGENLSEITIRMSYRYEDLNCPSFFKGTRLVLRYYESQSSSNSSEVSIYKNIGLGDNLTVPIENSGTTDIRYEIDINSKEVNTDKGLISQLQSFLINKNSGILEYTITPYMEFGYMTSFQKSGRIILDKLGTGVLEINKWQFYTDINKKYSLVRIGIESYPTEDTTIQYVQLVFENFKDRYNENRQRVTRRLTNNGDFNGEFEIRIDHDETFRERSLMSCTITANMMNKEKERHIIERVSEIEEPLLETHFLITTPMYNEEYVSRAPGAYLKEVIKDDNSIKFDFFDSFPQKPIILESSTTLSGTSPDIIVSEPKNKILTADDPVYSSFVKYKTSKKYKLSNVHIRRANDYVVNLSTYNITSISSIDNSSVSNFQGIALTKPLSTIELENNNISIDTILTVNIYGGLGNILNGVKLLKPYYQDKVYGYRGNTQVAGVEYSIKENNRSNFSVKVSLYSGNGGTLTKVSEKEIKSSDKEYKNGHSHNIFLNRQSVGSKQKVESIRSSVTNAIGSDYELLPLLAITKGNPDTKDWDFRSQVTVPINANKYDDNSSIILLANYNNKFIYIDSIFSNYVKLTPVDLETLLGILYNIYVLKEDNSINYYSVLVTSSDSYIYNLNVGITGNVEAQFKFNSEGNDYTNSDVETWYRKFRNTPYIRICNTITSSSFESSIRDSINSMNVSKLIASIENSSNVYVNFSNPEGLKILDNTIYYIKNGNICSANSSLLTTDEKTLLYNIKMNGQTLNFSNLVGREEEHSITDDEWNHSYIYSEHKSGNDAWHRAAWELLNSGLQSVTVKLKLSNNHVNAK